MDINQCTWSVVSRCFIGWFFMNVQPAMRSLSQETPEKGGEWADQAGEEIHTVPMMGWSNLSLDPECKYPPSLDAWMLKFSRNKWTKRNLNGQRGTISLSLYTVIYISVYVYVYV